MHFAFGKRTPIEVFSLNASNESSLEQSENFLSVDWRWPSVSEIVKVKPIIVLAMKFPQSLRFRVVNCCLKVKCLPPTTVTQIINRSLNEF